MLDKQPDDFFKDTSSSANFYQQVLEMFQDQILGEVDMAFIEETLRRYYLHIGWQMYSFDRLINSLVRFALVVVSSDSKDKSLDIYNLFKKDRVNDTTSHKSEISYRKAVEKYAKDADTYRITYVSHLCRCHVLSLTLIQDPAKTEATVRLFKKDDPTFDTNALDRTRRWRAYLASYQSIEPTEEVDPNNIKHPFLKKRLAKAEDLAEQDERLDHTTHSDKITVSISPQTYNITFINSEPFGTGGVQYFTLSDAIRAGLSDGASQPSDQYKLLNDARRERAQEKLVHNNTWMRDLSRDEVDSKKATFKKSIDEIKQASDNEDVEMAEA
jgi:paired amphipathic helix protein Sin3a